MTSWDHVGTQTYLYIHRAAELHLKPIIYILVNSLWPCELWSRQGWGQIRFIKYKYKYKNLDFSNTNTNIFFNFDSNTNTNTNTSIQIEIQQATGLDARASRVKCRAWINSFLSIQFQFKLDSRFFNSIQFQLDSESFNSIPIQFIFFQFQFNSIQILCSVKNKSIR